MISANDIFLRSTTCHLHDFFLPKLVHAVWDNLLSMEKKVKNAAGKLMKCVTAECIPLINSLQYAHFFYILFYKFYYVNTFLIK